MGLSVQRATFIVVDKVTGEPLTQFISWSDRRGNKTVEKINKSFFMKLLKGTAFVLYSLSHKNIFKQGIGLKLSNNFVSKFLI